MELARKPRQATQQTAVQKQRAFEYTVTFSPHPALGRKISFSRQEARHLAIAALLVVGVGLATGLYSRYFSIGYTLDYAMLSVFTAVLTGSFLAHEIAHKLVAQREGFWAEFRITFMGAMLTLISILSPLFKIISPGAVMIAGVAERRTMGRISIAGPLTNIVLSAIFLASAWLLTPYSLVFTLMSSFNAWIALFNLIPLGILDGFKVFAWDRRIWTLAFTTSLILTLLSYRLL